MSEEEVAAILRRHSTSAETDYQVHEVQNVIKAYNSVLLARDLNELASIGLLRAVDGLYRADSEALMSLLPLTVPPDETSSAAPR